MDRRVRYELLSEEPDGPPAPAEPVTLWRVVSPVECQEQPDPELPPQYTPEQGQGELGKQNAWVPPAYDVATTLPSYEDAERSKQLEAEQQEQAEFAQSQDQAEADRLAALQLGTDGMFFCTFLIAFLFNWLGLLASLCITHTLAGRLGAIAGFGLSMVKWVAIVKHNNWMAGVADGDSWLWWMLIVLGFLIFLRGCMQYIRLKYQWNQIHMHFKDRAYLFF